MSEYLINGDTGEFVLYSTDLGSVYFSAPWRDATQEEIDAYLLVGAKVAKIDTLKTAKQSFCDAGLAYSGDDYPLSNESAQDIILKQNLLSYESDDVSVMGSTQAYILPAGHGIKMISDGQIITVSGYDEAANNGDKTVASFEGDFVVVDEAVVDEAVGDDVVISSYSRYKYHDTDDVQHDFVNDAGWNSFSNAIMVERDRIMRYDCDKKREINDCTTVAAVDAVTIDFSA